MITCSPPSDLTLHPSLAIVIVNYNYDCFLKAAIESALNQCQPAEQIIVIDDGSTDNSRSIIAHYGSRIETCLKENGGQASTYNRGVTLAQTDLILFLDSDDLLETDCVRKVISQWQPGTVKLQFPLILIDADTQPTGGMIPRVRHTGNLNSIAQKFGGYISPPSSGNVYCRHYLTQIFPLDESNRYSADCIPSTLAPCYGQVISLGDSLGRHRIHKFKAQSTEGEGQGLNHASEPGWLDRTALRDYQAFLQFKEHLHQQTGQVYQGNTPAVPSQLRFMAIRQRSTLPLPDLPKGRRLCLTGAQSAFQYPDYVWYERCLLILWFAFLWLMPARFISWLVRHELGIKISGSPRWTPPAR